MRRIAIISSVLLGLALSPSLWAQTKVNVQNGGKVTVGGTSTTTMKIEAGGTLTVSGTSTFALSATSTTTPAEMTRLGSSGTYTVIVNSSSTLEANNFKFDYINLDGLQIRNGAKLTKLRNGTFSNPPNSGVYLNLKELTSTESLTDDFQSNSIGTDPSGWTVQEYNGVDNPSPGNAETRVDVVDGSGFGGTTRIVKIEYDGVNSGETFFSRSLTGTASGYVTFKVRRGQTNQQSYIRLSDGTNNFTVRYDTDGNVKTPEGTAQTYAAYSANTWYTVRIEWNIVAGSGDTWTVSINGTPQGTSDWNNGVNYGNITSVKFANVEDGTSTLMYIDDFRHVIYTTGTGLDGTDRSDICYSANNVTFNSSSSVDISSVRAGPKTPVIYFLGNTTDNGDRWGESYDDDPFDRIRWLSGIIRRSGGTTFDSFEKALASAGTTTHTLTALKQIPLDENLDLNGKNVIIENAIFAPGSGSAVINSTGTATGTLRNTVIAAGGVSTVNAVQNVTFFRVDSADPVLVVTNSTVANSLIESTSTLTGTTTSTSLLISSADFFVDRSFMDFHLRAPGGSPDTATAIDQGASISGITTDVEGKTRPYDHPSVANGTSTFDMGAYEHRGLTPVIPTASLDLGNSTRIAAGGARPNAANSATENVIYAITAGGSSSTGNDYKLIVLGSTTFNVISTFTVNYPITYMTYYTVATSPIASFERRLFLVIDYDFNGEGDRIMAVTDRGADEAIAVDSGFDGAGDPEGDGEGVKPFGNGPITWLTLLRIDGEAAVDEEPTDNPTRGRRLYFISGNVLYKVNAASQDTTDDGSPPNERYGDIIWSNSSRRWDHRAVLNYLSAIGDLFVAASDHSSGGSDNRTIVAQLKAGGHSNDPAVVKRYWVTNDTDDGTGAPSDNIVDENANGQIIYSNANNTVIYIAPTDGKKIISIAGTSTTGSDELGTRRFPNPSQGSDATTDWLDALAFRYFNTNYIIYGAGEKVYKMYDDGAVPAAGDDGKLVNNLGDSEWPKSINGSVTSRITKSGNYVYWGTKNGYIYGKGFNGSSHASSTDESDIEGYPYLIAPGHRVTEVWVTSEGMYFVTDQGKILRFTLQ